MSHTTLPIPSRYPSTNGPLPDHPPPPIAPTTVEKFLGIPTTTSVHFACTLFTLVETLAFMLSGVAGASYNSPRPRLAVPFVAALFFLLLWHQQRCVRDLLLTHSHLDCEAGSTATAEARMSVEGQEDLEFFAGFQAVVLLGVAFLMLVLTCWVGHAGAAIVAGALASGVGFLGFVEFCREIRLEDVRVGRNKGGEEREAHQEVVEESAAPPPSTTGKKGGEEQEEQAEQEEQEEHQEVAEASAASSPSTTGTGTKQPGQPLHRRLSCIPEEGDDSSEHGGDNHSPADLVLSQQMQDLVWTRVRYLAARKTPRERRRKKLLVRRAMRESQGESTRGWSGDGGFSAMPADSAQRVREEDSEGTVSDRDRDRQGEVDGSLRKGGERMGGVLGGTRDDGDTSVTFSSEQPLFTTMPTMGTNSIFPPQQQQQTFQVVGNNPFHLPPAKDRIDARQQQEQHIEAMNRLARAKDAEIATLRTQIEGMTRYFRTREEACRAAHAAEIANAWRNAQVLFEKVGKLEGMLTAEKIARKEVEVGEGEWIGNWNGKIEQEEKMGRKLGIFAQEEKKGERWVGVENDSVRKRQQEDEVAEEEEVSKGNNVEGPVIDLPLCQNAGCFCHFPVVPQRTRQQQRQGETSKGEQEVAITSHDHVDELDEDETDDDNDDAFTIILDSDPPSLSSFPHNVEISINLAPPDGDETPLCQNADCSCHFPVLQQPHLQQPSHQLQQQREKVQPAQNDERRPIVPDHGSDAGSENKNEDENEEDDEEDDDAFTIIIESSIPPPPSSSSTPLSSHGVESPEDLASMEGSEISLSEWEMDSDFDFDSDSGSDSEGIDERIHV
ncbi:hypothetical protein KC318_g768 [Hortaea werneckii]|nr:hypothetical protein KC334_g7150 [Hortaea werneckii]KAI7003139.1 hypothetical protein KC355_g9384 [Hortaea werneckii]KAI7675717.1 hypothetical protein KC318_g768 [Hortaea werneckii]